MFFFTYLADSQSLNEIKVGVNYRGLGATKSTNGSYDLKGEFHGVFGELRVMTTTKNIVHQLSFNPMVKGTVYNYFISKEQTFEFINRVEAEFNITFEIEIKYEGSKIITYFKITKGEINYYLRTASFDNAETFLLTLSITHVKLGRKHYNRKKEIEDLFLKSSIYKA